MVTRNYKGFLHRGFLTGVAIVGLTACNASNGGPETERVGTARQAIVESEVEAKITAKWTQLGGAAQMGIATTSVELVPQRTDAWFQKFERGGVIVYSDAYGAVDMFTEQFDKWTSLFGQVAADGSDLMAFVGLPMADTVNFVAYQEVAFERGMVVRDPTATRLVAGQLYLRYVALELKLGPPVSDEADEDGGGRFQQFQHGELHYRADLSGAFMLDGAILSRWRALGGGASPLGFPTTDVAEVAGAGGAAIGRMARFQGGPIYENTSTGAWELTGSLLTEYEQNYGGPGGWLGLPIAAPAVNLAGESYVDFQGGVLAEHVFTSGAGVVAFRNLDFFLDLVRGHTDDCGGPCEGADLYTYLDITATNGFHTDHQRIPDSGDSDGQDLDPNLTQSIGKANSALAIDVTLDVLDADLVSDDHLGSATVHYSIDNLWGLDLADTTHHGQGDDGTMDATFVVQSSGLPYDASDFGMSLWWSFSNFKTAKLSYDQFATNFEDVDPDESLIHWPNRALYDNVYKTNAKDGNCFGMCLLSVYSQLGQSAYVEPIHKLFAVNEHVGGPLDGYFPDPNHVALAAEINLKHGRQVSASVIGWAVDRFLSGNTHDPNDVFEDSRQSAASGNFPLIMVGDDYFFGKSHVVRAIRWDDASPNCPNNGAPPCRLIHVADPNAAHIVPSVPPQDEVVEIDSTETFRFDSGSTHYEGGNWSGGRMYFTPATLAFGKLYTPLDLQHLIENGIVAIFGSGGQVQQVSDDAGRTLFNPSLGAPPTKWSDIVQDPGARLPGLAPVMLPTDGPQPQIYAGKGLTNVTHYYDIAAAAGMSAGAPYLASFHSGRLSSYFTIPATPGKPDRVGMEKIGTDDRAFSLSVPASGASKSVTFGISGANKDRWAEFSALGLSPAQKIRMRTAHAGYRVLVDNDGPATTAHLKVQSGAHSLVVDLGTVDIPAGATNIDFDAPRTTLSTSGVTTGNAGWLVAPVTVTLTAQDFSGSGIALIEYGTDGVHFTPYSGPFSYANQGVTTLYYRARDRQNNQELAKSQVFMIDTQLPQVAASVASSNGVRLTYGVTDSTPGSGVAGVHFIQSGGSPSFLSAASGTIKLNGSCSTVELWGEDVAGNLTTPHVMLADSVAPVFTFVPASIKTTHCTATAGLVLGLATATDDCGSVSVTNDAPARFPLGTTTVTWTARDAAGNVSTRAQTVTTDLADDSSCCPAGTNVIKGTSSSETLTGTAGNDCILGFGGQDIIKGLGGNDVLSGGDGDDQIWGGDGNDWLSGGSGQDTLRGENGDDVCSGDDGDDYVYGGASNDRLIGGAGQDHLFCEAGDDTADGGPGDDTIDGGAGNDTLSGGPDHDTYFGGGGSDRCVQDGFDRLNACVATAP